MRKQWYMVGLLYTLDVRVPPPDISVEDILKEGKSHCAEKGSAKGTWRHNSTQHICSFLDEIPLLTDHEQGRFCCMGLPHNHMHWVTCMEMSNWFCLFYVVEQSTSIASSSKRHCRGKQKNPVRIIPDQGKLCDSDCPPSLTRRLKEPQTM